MTSYDLYAKLRNEKGMKDVDVAKSAHISPSTFTDWKQGRSKPKEEKMRKIADALGVTYLELLGMGDDVISPIKDAYVNASKEDDESRAATLVIAYLAQLNEDGFEEAIKRIEELTQLDKYRKDDEG